MDKLRELECFVSVVESGSFVRAADQTGMSTTAVSRAVLGLESRLHARLLHRSTRRLSLTDAGRNYFDRCKHILSALQEADDMLSETRFAPSGVLRVGAPLSFGIQHLAPLWPDFLSHYPDVHLDVVLSDEVTDLVETRLDVAIRIARLSRPGLVQRRLAQTRLIACAAPSYIARNGLPTHPAALARHAIISYTYFSGKDEWTFTGPDGPTSVRVQPAMRANNGDTCVQAARSGMGIVLQPSFLVAQDLAQGHLIPLLPGYHADTIGVFAVYPTHRYLPVNVRALVDFLIATFNSANWNEPAGHIQHPSIGEPQ